MIRLAPHHLMTKRSTRRPHVLLSLLEHHAGVVGDDYYYYYHHQRSSLLPSPTSRWFCCCYGSWLSSRSYSSTTTTFSKSTTTTNNNNWIPEPTWSLKDLQLDVQHTPLPSEEVDRLAHRALIYTNNTNNNKNPQKALLEQDLANMMHMIQQVSEYHHHHHHEQTTTTTSDDDNVENDGSDLLYDLPRGIMHQKTTPLRKKNDSFEKEDQQQASKVWETLLQPKTTRIGGLHEYFAIATVADDNENNSKNNIQKTRKLQEEDF